MKRSLFVRVVSVITLIISSSAHTAEFNFVAIGDMPYGAPEEAYGPYETLINTINATKPELVIHVGDTKSGSTPCSNQMLDDQLNYLNTIEGAVLYTPGDNEWTDCYRKKAGEFEPLERLDYIRKNYFNKDPSMSLGTEPVSLESQSADGYPENSRMELNGVMFITAHVVGSNNNFETRDITAVEEFMARDVANVKWLKESFTAAADSAAIVLAIHADMFEFDFNSFGEESWLRHSGFNKFGPALQEVAAAYGKPVLLIYGDSHVFRQMRPFPSKAPNVMSLEVFGSKQMHAAQIAVNTDAPGVFSVAPLINPDIAN